MVREIIVGDGDGGGAHDGIEEAIGATGERHVVDPHVPRAEQRDAVTVREAPPPEVSGRAPNKGLPGAPTIVDVDPMNDDIGDVLDGDARAARDVDVVPAAVDRLVAVHEELLRELDGHVGGEDDPEGLLLDGRVPEGPGRRLDRVGVRGVGHHVESAVLPARRVPPEPDPALRETLAVRFPLRIAPPAVVDRVSRILARRRRQRRRRRRFLPRAAASALPSNRNKKKEEATVTTTTGFKNR